MAFLPTSADLTWGKDVLVRAATARFRGSPGPALCALFSFARLYVIRAKGVENPQVGELAQAAKSRAGKNWYAEDQCTAPES